MKRHHKTTRRPDPQTSTARLIAAAPDLLAACRLILSETDPNVVVQMVRAAIAKAEGR